MLRSKSPEGDLDLIHPSQIQIILAFFPHRFVREERTAKGYVVDRQVAVLPEVKLEVDVGDGRDSATQRMSTCNDGIAMEVERTLQQMVD